MSDDSEPDGPAERYGLTWPGKAAAGRTVDDPVTTVLSLDAVSSVDPDHARDVFVEGDNLEALKHLLVDHRGQVRLIYVDPPYNARTDGVYADDWTESRRSHLARTQHADDGSRRHSRWLSMVYPRLLLARDLLAPDGVLLVSIDDHEMPTLALVLREVFGEDNLVVTFVWQKKRKPSYLHRTAGSMTEYVLAVVKDASRAFPFAVDVTTVGKKYPINNAGNTPGVLCFPAGSVRFGVGEASYAPQDMSQGNIVTRLLDPVEVRGGVNLDAFRLEGEWRYSQRRIEEIVAAGEAITISKVPFRPNHVRAGGAVKKMHNLLTPHTYDVGTNEDATAELAAILGGVYFDNPKPTSLVRTLAKAVTYDDPEAVVVDFFAGSGTTGHAVALLNAEDGGRRRVVSVNLPEPIDPASEAGRAGFATVADITRARLAWVARHVPGAGGLRCYRLEPLADRSEDLLEDPPEGR